MRVIVEGFTTERVTAAVEEASMAEGIEEMPDDEEIAKIACETLATRAFMLADAMLAESEKEPGS